ncbi:hypothetical protein BSY239_4224 [Hydrogenophaga sp. RAC07]|uniref:hypothetical protein n=1 Tax=Hydrogenophaga sp. RAC07 TaxID=1842537 RepID=UPI00083D284A|nr:hypothetical protein [Hydrogenophaga sp. RAC07]AOF87248.1 hypothetical protein BSY239_4224 [Hydrogenophaga sp. RAC07]
MRTPIRFPPTPLLLAALCLTASAAAQASDHLICKDATTPEGATQVGALQPLFRDCPRITDIDFTGRADGHKFYSGVYTGPPKDRSFYEQADDGVLMQRGGVLATVKTSSFPGRFPLLSGARPFYIEAQVATSSNHRDNFPAIWLMPIEHNARMEDVYEGDPKSFERWFELDIDEGGFGPGGHHTAISWSGIWPHYKKIQNPNPTSKVPLDRTQPNVFGVSYSPDTLTVRWWLNGRPVLEATQPHVPEIARRQNFYLIVSAQSHKNISHYQMKLLGVRAFVGDATTASGGATVPARRAKGSP